MLLLLKRDVSGESHDCCQNPTYCTELDLGGLGEQIFRNGTRVRNLMYRPAPNRTGATRLRVRNESRCVTSTIGLNPRQWLIFYGGSLDPFSAWGLASGQ